MVFPLPRRLPRRTPLPSGSRAQVPAARPARSTAGARSPPPAAPAPAPHPIPQDVRRQWPPGSRRQTSPQSRRQQPPQIWRQMPPQSRRQRPPQLGPPKIGGAGRRRPSRQPIGWRGPARPIGRAQKDALRRPLRHPVGDAATPPCLAAAGGSRTLTRCTPAHSLHTLCIRMPERPAQRRQQAPPAPGLSNWNDNGLKDRRVATHGGSIPPSGAHRSAINTVEQPGGATAHIFWVMNRMLRYRLMLVKSELTVRRERLMRKLQERSYSFLIRHNIIRCHWSPIENGTSIITVRAVWRVPPRT